MILPKKNLKPGALERMGFGPEALRRAHPRLIVCSVSGYGESGPLADRKAYDLLIQAESGLSSITRTRRRRARGTISKRTGVVPGCSPSSSIGSGSFDSTVTVDDPDFEVRLNPSDRRDAQFKRIVATALEADRTGFRRAIGDRRAA